MVMGGASLASMPAPWDLNVPFSFLFLGSFRFYLCDRKHFWYLWEAICVAIFLTTAFFRTSGKQFSGYNSLFGLVLRLLPKHVVLSLSE